MKNLLLLMVVMIVLAGCAYPTTANIPRTSKPLIENGQVIVLAKHGCWESPSNVECRITVKNLGPYDVKNIKFLFKLRDGRYEDASGTIGYLPAKETIDFEIWATYVGDDPIRSEVKVVAPVVVEKYEVIPSRQ